MVLGTNDGGGFELPAVPPGVLRGTLWLDANDDGVRQPWESPLSGVPVTLDGATTVTADGFGRYSFANLAAGSYSLTADLPVGLSAAIPSVSVTDGRGAAMGIAVRSDFNVYLPIVMR